MRTHKDLDLWHASVALAAMVYETTKTFPAEERFGLVSQMRRAAVSIASNIAEGAARQTAKEFMHFLSMAAGSASELDTQIEICLLTKQGDTSTLQSIQQELDRISRMIQGLIRSIRAKQ